MSLFQLRDWEGSDLAMKGLVTLNTLGDGSCFFHSIVAAYYPDYIEGYDKDRKAAFDKISFIRELRKDLAKKLESRKDPRDPSSPLWYNYLAKGNISLLGRDDKSFTLKSLQEHLYSNGPVGVEFLELTSDVLDIDIYIVDGNNGRMYNHGGDLTLLWKGRKSVVICYHDFHFSTTGLRVDSNTIQTLFNPDEPFVKHLQDKYNENILHDLKN